MTLIVDASLAVAALTNDGPSGIWARQILVSDNLAAPHLLPNEVATVLRRRSLAGEISEDVATIAHSEFQAITMDFHAYDRFATRIWELRHTVTIHDAWYVAVAEALDSPLATLDVRLARAPGPRCHFVTPPAR